MGQRLGIAVVQAQERDSRQPGRQLQRRLFTTK